MTDAAGSAAVESVPAQAAAVFADRLERAEEYVQLLATAGVERGLIGPRETPRLWTRHLLNSVAVAEFLPDRADVIDLGSGAGLPGIPVALARPDVRMTLVEPQSRRTRFLEEVVERLLLDVAVRRARAEELPKATTDAVVVRAVAPLSRLIALALPLLRPGGRLLALKGSRADDEVAAASSALRAWPHAKVETHTVNIGPQPTTVVQIVLDEAQAHSGGCTR